MQFICLDDYGKIYKGISGKHYQFINREPLTVENVDIKYFKGKPDTFIEYKKQNESVQKEIKKEIVKIIKKSIKKQKNNLNLGEVFSKKEESQTPIEKGKKLKEVIKKKNE